MTNAEISQAVNEEANKLSPSAVVELFSIDASALGEPDVLNFHNGTNGLTEAVFFNGIEYLPLPIHVQGMEFTATERQPRPTITISNVGGFMSSLLRSTKDLAGAMFTRRRTFAKYLDGQPTAAPVEYDPDVYFVEQKLHSNRVSVELELSSSLDMDGVMFPLRQVLSSYCSHDDYRGAGCDFAENMVVTDANNLLFAGADRFYGAWSPFIHYVATDSVGYFTGGYYGIYVAGAAAFGDAQLPSNASYWTRVQRFRGQYSLSTTGWLKGDVAFIYRQRVRLMAQLIVTPGAGEVVPAPPNSLYWKADQCGRFLAACKRHFDPRKINQPLKYGGFPGVLSVPSDA